MSDVTGLRIRDRAQHVQRPRWQWAWSMCGPNTHVCRSFWDRALTCTMASAFGVRVVSGPLVTLNKPQGLPVTGTARAHGRACRERGFACLRGAQGRGGELWDGAWAVGAPCTFPSLSRKTRRADLALGAARAEQVPGAWGVGIPGRPGTWEVSGGDRRVGAGVHLQQEQAETVRSVSEPLQRHSASAERGYQYCAHCAGITQALLVDPRCSVSTISWRWRRRRNISEILQIHLRVCRGSD